MKTTDVAKRHPHLPDVFVTEDRHVWPYTQPGEPTVSYQSRTLHIKASGITVAASTRRNEVRIYGSIGIEDIGTVISALADQRQWLAARMVEQGSV